MRDFPYLRLGIRDFKAKSGRDLGLKVCVGGGMPKVTLGITELPEILGRDYGIEKPYWGPSNLTCHCLFVNYEDGQYSSIGDLGRVRRDTAFSRW